MTLRARLARLERQQPATAATGPYGVKLWTPGDYAAFVALHAEFAAEHPSARLIREQERHERGDADGEA